MKPAGARNPAAAARPWSGSSGSPGRAGPRLVQPRQQDVSPEDVHREHRFDGDAAFGMGRRTHPLVGSELRFGTFVS